MQPCGGEVDWQTVALMGNITMSHYRIYYDVIFWCVSVSTGWFVVYLIYCIYNLQYNVTYGVG